MIELIRKHLGTVAAIAPNLPRETLLRVAGNHAVFLDPDELVLAVIDGAGDRSPLLLTDRRIGWAHEGRLHRLEYSDIRPGGLKVRARVVTVPPRTKLARRPDSMYAIALADEPTAQALAALLGELMTAAPAAPGSIIAGIRGSELSSMVRGPGIRPPVSAIAPSAPVKPAATKPTGSAKRGKQPPAPPRTSDEILAMAAAGDPGTVDAITRHPRPDPDLLWNIHRMGSPFSRRVILDVLRAGNFRHGIWRGVKRICKDAEAARDAEIVGTLAHRFDIDNDFSGYLTRRYMRRRAWRFLRRMAHQSPVNYPYFAAEVLIGFTDDELTRTHQTYSQHNGKWLYVVRDNALRYWTLCQILHRRSSGVEASTEHATFRVAGVDMAAATGPGSSRAIARYALPRIDAACGHAFPELWAKNAEPLLHVTARAVSEPIRRWAIARLKADHAPALARLTFAAVRTLMECPHPTSAAFGWDLLESHIDPALVPDDVLLAALASNSSELVERARRFLERHRPGQRIPASTWIELAMGPSAAAAAYAEQRLRQQRPLITFDEARRLLRSPHANLRRMGLELVLGDPTKPVEPVVVVAELDTAHGEIRAALLAAFDRIAWTPAAATALFDLPYADVAGAARALVERNLDTWDAGELLPPIAETPDTAVLEWAANLVIAHLGRKPDRLRALTPFFRRVLYRVNACGSAKRSLLAFLRTAATRDPASAPAALPLLREFVRSVGRLEFETALAQTVRWAIDDPATADRLRADAPWLTVATAANR